MRAALIHAFGEPDVIQTATLDGPLDDQGHPVADPAALAERGTLTVRLHASGVNPVDTYLRAGQYAALPELPYIPGFDGAGIVEHAPEHATDALGQPIPPGTRVYVYHKPFGPHARSGTAAERCLCEPWQVHRLGDTLSFAQGACIGIPYGTAWRALIQRPRPLGRGRPGDTVLVRGATGGVGTAAVQIARFLGMRTIATGGTPEGRDLLASTDVAADLVLDHHDPDVDRQIRAHAPDGVDLILEMRADLNLDRDLDLLSRGGVVVVVGSRGRVEIDPRRSMGRESAVLGMTLPSATPDELREIHAGLAALFGIARTEAQTTTADNRPHAAPIVHQVFGLDEAAEAHRRVSGQPARGQIVLDCTR